MSQHLDRRTDAVEARGQDLDAKAVRGVVDVVERILRRACGEKLAEPKI